MDDDSNSTLIAQMQHKQRSTCDRQQSSVSSSSSVLTNSSTSPSSSLTSISTNSPTTSNSISNSHSARSVSISSSSANTNSNATASASASSGLATQVPSASSVATVIVATDAAEAFHAPAELHLDVDFLPQMQLLPGASEREEHCEFLSEERELCQELSRQHVTETATVEEHFGEIFGPSELLDDICAAEHALDSASRGIHERYEASVVESTRLERSNSCSQAEASAAQLAAAAAAATANATAAHSVGASSVSHDNLVAVSSLSQQRIPTIVGSCLERRSTDEQLIHKHDSSIYSDIAQNPNECADVRPGVTSNNSRLQNQALSFASSSSRFFSSKLNTGSLWSLLSVGSNSSTNTADMTNTDNLDQSSVNDQAEDSNTVDDNQRPSDNRQIGNIFSRVQFKLSNNAQNQQQQSIKLSKTLSEINNSQATPELQSGARQELGPVAERKKFRFHVKYFGSSMLHKNFTLPMLEWIAKDIRRQTVKGAQIVSQRQFTIPVRDIFLEIQSYHITATSCKDGHCVFAHPMHFVSKYAQLQHDPTCFAYLIRETKDSPLFCHVFQAKNANKVHDIFNAIREITTRTQICHPTLPPTLTAATNLQPNHSSDQKNSCQSGYKVQKSASSDLKDMLGLRHNEQLTIAPTTISSFSKSHQSIAAKLSQEQIQSQREQTNNQFENSYQFEVMLVKKVKVQRRRVPASFVDDALETLKSFEVLKGGESKSQIKGVGKRIISASVDERQEYDEACQSPTPTNPNLTPQFTQQLSVAEARSSIDTDVQRRGSSVSLHTSDQTIKEERESRSCQQSPTKVPTNSEQNDGVASFSRQDKDGLELKKHQSADSLNDMYNGETPCYTNDFSPYNTITSTDLNERIAAIPVVSSSVSLDHETRQKLARQVRETIMATAANIKKGVYASGDKLDRSASSKALDSLSCTVTSDITVEREDQDLIESEDNVPDANQKQSKVLSGEVLNDANWNSNSESRRLSANACPRFLPQSSNNFDLFRRASARQVVRNRTVLLLIGKDELCTISIDQHQLLFSKSFSSIVHCLQGSNNKDHFGLICRDSGKINPNAESYAGFIFKCQSEKVVREIMGALKQVIYSSQHNYHGYYSPYNPLNTVATGQYTPNQSPKLDRNQQKQASNPSQIQQSSLAGPQLLSLAAKRGFSNPIEIHEASCTKQLIETSTASPFGTIYQRTNPTPSSSSTITTTTAPSQPKNLIKSMFCDNCPLYWYHRLCCDIESLPAEASKSIILRRIDSSMTDKEQDELYSKFSEFNIDSIGEHNEIFMSLLRHLCEKKQFKHAQTSLHLNALAKIATQAKQSSTTSSSVSRQSSLQNSGSLLSAIPQNEPSLQSKTTNSHQRSGSSSGSLAFVLGQSNANHATQSLSDAGSAAIDNFKKAKNSISSSIENMLKRRSSMRDECQDESALSIINLPTRAGSFKSASRESRTNAQDNEKIEQASGNLKRSQSSTAYHDRNLTQSIPSWKDSFSRTTNDELSNPIIGLFRKRNSGQGSKLDETSDSDIDPIIKNDDSDPTKHQVSPNMSNSSGFMFPSKSGRDSLENSTSSSMLTSVFWKKSIFDKIRQPVAIDDKTSNAIGLNEKISLHNGELIGIRADESRMTPRDCVENRRKRTSEELRSLWRKAIIEQITLLKMDKQNQSLLANTVECDIQRIKLNYRDVLYSKGVAVLWDKLLKQNPTQKVEFSEVARLVRKGVPKQRRGEIWMFLMNQYQLRHGTSFQPADSEFHGDANQTYRDLLSQLSIQQHEIFVDIGRTFPSHPYYSQYLSLGQLSLFNILKAYSLLDPEVGYCQGLSFVAGILLLHVNSEDEAFELMRHILFDFGLRKQYLPSMTALHLQLYQLTRLLRDYEYDLFNHFDQYDISPSLYAAPWFLTLFASQFPLGFVARLLDLISLIGIEAIFRVSLNLLTFHRDALLACKSLESTMDFIRTDLVKIDDKNLVNIFDKSMTLDLRNKLIEYEIEYTFYCAEDRAKLASREARRPPNQIADSKHSSNNNTNSLEKTSKGENSESTSVVADATATVIIQHLLANNHLKSLRSNYSY